eukprot:325304-Amphidinium_carterae.2
MARKDTSAKAERAKVATKAPRKVAHDRIICAHTVVRIATFVTAWRKAAFMRKQSNHVKQGDCWSCHSCPMQTKSSRCKALAEERQHSLKEKKPGPESRQAERTAESKSKATRHRETRFVELSTLDTKLTMYLSKHVSNAEGETRPKSDVKNVV